MTKTEKEMIFKKYTPLLKKQAFIFSKASGIDQKELFAEASLNYCRCIDYYEPEKSALGTFIYTCTRHHLINYCKENAKRAKLVIHLDTNTLPDKEKEKDYYLELFETSDNKVLREIAKIIKTDIHTIQQKEQKRNWLDKFIHKATGISYKEIWKGFELAKTIMQG